VMQVCHFRAISGRFPAHGFLSRTLNRDRLPATTSTQIGAGGVFLQRSPQPAAYSSSRRRLVHCFSVETRAWPDQTAWCSGFRVFAGIVGEALPTGDFTSRQRVRKRTFAERLQRWPGVRCPHTGLKAPWRGREPGRFRPHRRAPVSRPGTLLSRSRGIFIATRGTIPARRGRRRRTLAISDTRQQQCRISLNAISHFEPFEGLAFSLIDDKIPYKAIKVS
jgi:hypothetical protein